MWTELIGGAAIAATVANGYLIYKGSDRASQRTAEVQQQNNATTGFLQLTQEQRTELTELRSRVRESEESARKAKEAAESAQTITETCQRQQASLVEAYRELWEWASQPCPHDGPPPRPPTRIWA